MNEKTQYWLDQFFLFLVLLDPLGGIRIFAGKQMELGLIMVFVVQLLFIAYLYNHVHTLTNLFSQGAQRQTKKVKKSLMSQGPMIFCMLICMIIFGKLMPSILYIYKSHNYFDIIIWCIVIGYMVWRFMDTEFCRNITGAGEAPALYKRLPWILILTSVFTLCTGTFPMADTLPLIKIWAAAFADLILLTILCKVSQKRKTAV